MCELAENVVLFTVHFHKSVLNNISTYIQIMKSRRMKGGKILVLLTPFSLIL